MIKMLVNLLLLSYVSAPVVTVAPTTFASSTTSGMLFFVFVFSKKFRVTFISSIVGLQLCRHLLVQIQQWKHEDIV